MCSGVDCFLCQAGPWIMLHASVSNDRAAGLRPCSWCHGGSMAEPGFCMLCVGGLLSSQCRKAQAAVSAFAPLSSLKTETKEQFNANQCT